MENKNNSGLPVVIIGAVLLVVLIGGWWFYNNSKNTPTTSNANKTTIAVGIPANAPPGASPAWSLGSPSAVVTVEEFADFQCPTCATMHPKVKELRVLYGDRVRITFRQFPLQQNSYEAACATEAAGLQGKFWDMQNIIFTNQRAWSGSTNPRQVFTEYAKTIGLDVERFSNDISGLQVKNRVDSDLQRGRAIGVNSTPSFFVNNKPLGRELDSLRQVVEAELQKAEAAKQTPANSSNSDSTENANSATNK